MYSLESRKENKQEEVKTSSPCLGVGIFAKWVKSNDARTNHNLRIPDILDCNSRALV
jgi:hypothetical protein